MYKNKVQYRNFLLFSAPELSLCDCPQDFFANQRAYMSKLHDGQYRDNYMPLHRPMCHFLLCRCAFLVNCSALSAINGWHKFRLSVVIISNTYKYKELGIWLHQDGRDNFCLHLLGQKHPFFLPEQSIILADTVKSSAAI